MSNILIFGDSIVSGLNDWQRGGWVERLKLEVFNFNEKHNTQHMVYNLGVDGDTSEGVLKRFRTEAGSLRSWPQSKNVIVFSIGLNDSIIANDINNKVESEKFRSNLEQIIQQSKTILKETNSILLRHPESRSVRVEESRYAYSVIFIGLTPVAEEKVSPVPWMPEYSYKNSEIEKYNEILKAVCQKKQVQHVDLFKKIDREEFIKYLDDGVHPNSKGHEIMFNIIRPYLLQCIT